MGEADATDEAEVEKSSESLLLSPSQSSHYRQAWLGLTPRLDDLFPCLAVRKRCPADAQLAQCHTAASHGAPHLVRVWACHTLGLPIL